MRATLCRGEACPLVSAKREGGLMPRIERVETRKRGFLAFNVLMGIID